MELALELKGITKIFGKTVANDHVDLTVKKGTVHAIIGENGAGKSTLMNIICGLYQADDGELYVYGEKKNFKNPSEASRAGIGMVHQEFMLFSELTVLDNIIMGYEPKKGLMIDRSNARKNIENICSQYHFNIPLDAYIKDLPVSMLQQIEIVKILFRGVSIIIFDEPTSVLTPQGVEGLFEAIRTLVKNGKTILFITHKLKEVLAISDEITVLKSGKMVGGIKPEAADETILASMMVGRDVLLTANKIVKKVGDIILEVDNLYADDYEGREKLKGASLKLRKGEILGIAGVAGSGQQELVECLFGLKEIKSGRVIYEGKDISKLNCRNHRNLKIGFVPQDRMSEGVNAEGAIWENAIMGYHITPEFGSKFFINKNKSMEFTDNIIRDFNVKTPSSFTKIRHLSGGNIQKIVVGREFSQSNHLLIIEDPTRGIDIGAIEFIWKKIEEMAATGTAILLVSHELNEVMEVSDRLMVMYDGRLYDAGVHGEKTESEIGLLMAGGKNE